MRVAFITTDNRDQLKNYGAVTPWFGPAPDALLQGFALLPEVEVHAIVCAREPMQSPEKVAPNIFFHCLVVPKIGWMRTGWPNAASPDSAASRTRGWSAGVRAAG